MVNTSRTEEIMGLDALLTAEEIEWRDKARAFSVDRIAPQIDEDFEIQRLREELIPELGALGMLGMHINGYGCSGANAVSYGLVCYELEAVDTSWRTHVSVLGSLAMSSIAKFGSEEQKQEWLPPWLAERRLVVSGSPNPTVVRTPPTCGLLPCSMAMNGSSTAPSVGSVSPTLLMSPSSGR